MKNNQVAHIGIQKMRGGKLMPADDLVAVEEPLQIKLEYSTINGRMQKNIAVTMRTPGNDGELAAGFLFTEGIIKKPADIQEIKQSTADENEVLVILQENVMPVLSNVARNFYSTSSCGICGKASIEAIQTVLQYQHAASHIFVNIPVLFSLQSRLKNQQKIFEDTGGIHASALFGAGGDFIMLREDVGRHNALDKVTGAAFLKNMLPLNNYILLLSGRASFELIQKAVMAGIKIVAAVGAPSSLAVELAKENDVTLTGFLREERFNVYSGQHRIVL